MAVGARVVAIGYRGLFINGQTLGNLGGYGGDRVHGRFVGIGVTLITEGSIGRTLDAPVRRESKCHRDVRRVRHLAFGQEIGNFSLLPEGRIWCRPVPAHTNRIKSLRTSSSIIAPFARIVGLRRVQPEKSQSLGRLV